MKKIIEHGYRQYMETKCPNCGCKFSYEWEDVEKSPCKYTYPNFTYTFPGYYITCPECHYYFQILNWKFTGCETTFTCSTEENEKD